MGRVSAFSLRLSQWDWNVTILYINVTNSLFYVDQQSMWMRLTRFCGTPKVSGFHKSGEAHERETNDLTLLFSPLAFNRTRLFEQLPKEGDEETGSQEETKRAKNKGSGKANIGLQPSTN